MKEIKNEHFEDDLRESYGLTVILNTLLHWFRWEYMWHVPHNLQRVIRIPCIG